MISDLFCLGLGEAFPLTLNRAGDGSSDRYMLPQDGWYQLARVGAMAKDLERSGAESVRIRQVVTGDDLAAIENRFATWAKDPAFSGLLVDFDHFSGDEDKSTRAAAWITNVQRRGDQLWGQLRLTSSGRAALEGGDFRHFSPVLGFEPREYRDGEEAHPVALLGGAFTNQPTFRGMVPLSNRQGDPLASTQRTEMDHKAKLITVLGLAATAQDAEIEAACVTLNSLRQKAADYDTVKNRLDALEAEQIERDLDEAELEGNDRETWKKALTKNREESLALLKTRGKGDGNRGDGAYRRTHNREGASTPRKAATDTKEQTIDQKREAAVRDYRTRNRCSFTDAWDAVRAEKPELFEDPAAAAE
jgi:phage I-like protein